MRSRGMVGEIREAGEMVELVEQTKSAGGDIIHVIAR